MRLREQAFGLHRGLDRVQHDADTARQLLEEGDLKVGEDVTEDKLDNGLHLVFEKHRQHDHIARDHFEQCRPDRNGVRGHFGDQQPSFVCGALTDQALAKLEALRMTVRTVIGIGRQEAQAAPSPSTW